MIPYFDADPLFTIPGIGLPIHLFGLLVATGVILGDRIVVREGQKRGMDANEIRFLNARMVIGGFIMAHLVSVIFYFPERILESPLVLVKFWSGLSSMGGFTGAFITYLYLTRHDKELRLKYADVVMLGLSVGWIFGRMGCTTAHDHPGRLSNFFLAVKYPGGSRHDLGFYELLFTLVLTAILFTYARKPRPAGRIVGLASVLYAPVRFCFDFLRATDHGRPDERYLHLTPAQWACIALFILGVTLLRKKTAVVEFTGPPPPQEDEEPAKPARRQQAQGARKKRRA